MNKYSDNAQFATLFKKYRLRSEIETLSEFGDLLAQEGIVYETSLFTRWQKGERVPKDRKVILTILGLFVKLGGLQTIEECNSFFEAANQRNLTQEEEESLKQHLHPLKNSKYSASKKIFFYASPLSNRFDHQINIIYKTIGDLGCTHLNHETQTHRLRNLMKKIDNGEDEQLMEYKKIIQNFIVKIKDSDICIFEISFKSLGGGYLIHLALTLSKPTIILYYKENKPHIFSAVVDERLILKSYNEQNLIKVVERVLNAANEKIF